MSAHPSWKFSQTCCIVTIITEFLPVNMEIDTCQIFPLKPENNMSRLSKQAHYRRAFDEYDYTQQKAHLDSE